MSLWLALPGSDYGCYILSSILYSSVLTHEIPQPPSSVPQFPEEDSKLRATALQLRRGGNCPNTLEVLQQLLHSGGGLDASSNPNQQDSAADVAVVTPPPPLQQKQQQQWQQQLKLHLVSILPDAGSSATRKILSSFAAPHAPHAPQPSASYDSKSLSESVTEPAFATATSVDFSHCLYRKGHDEAASSYIIRSSATGSRTIVNYNDLSEMTRDEFVKIVDDSLLRHNHSDDGSARGFAEEDYWWHFEVGSGIPVIHMLTEQSLRALRLLFPTFPYNKCCTSLNEAIALIIFTRTPTQGFLFVNTYMDYVERVEYQRQHCTASATCARS